MNLQIELFSTPTVEGRKILSSKGFVCANVVLGAGVIDDEYIAKWELPKYLDTDGVEPYHVELFNALENEVLSKGANAVIDLHMEHCYVNYGHLLDNRRLIISAQGTAVVLEGSDEIPRNKNINGKVLEQQILRKNILTKLKEWHEEYEKRKGDWYCNISAKEWEFICRYPDVSFADAMHLAYTGEVIDHGHKSDYYSFERERYSRYFKYFKKLPDEKQIELAYKYSDYQSSNLIVECDLFDAKQILEWAQKGEYEFATKCLKARKKEYSKQDLEDMQELYDFFANLPSDKIEEIVPDNEDPCRRKYICKNCGHEFDVFKDEYYCPSFMCQKNNKGLTKEQEERINEFGIKVETLKELISQNK
jgi:uncharacterized protein YbjQ (UPF0145 family)